MANLNGTSSTDAASAFIKAASDTSSKLLESASTATNTLLNAASFKVTNLFDNVVIDHDIESLITEAQLADTLLEVIQEYINSAINIDDDAIRHAQDCLTLLELITLNELTTLYKQREEALIKSCALLNQYFPNIFLVPFSIRKQVKKISLLEKVISYEEYYCKVDSLLLFSKLLASLTFTDSIDKLTLHSNEQEFIPGKEILIDIVAKYDEQCKYLILSKSLEYNNIDFAKTFCIEQMNNERLKSLGPIAVKLALNSFNTNIDDKLLALGLWGCS